MSVDWSNLPIKRNFLFKQGDFLQIPLQINKNGLPVDLTGLVASFAAWILNQGVRVDMHVTLANQTANKGLLYLSLTAAETLTIKNYSFLQCVFTDGNSRPVTILEGSCFAGVTDVST